MHISSSSEGVSSARRHWRKKSYLITHKNVFILYLQAPRLLCMYSICTGKTVRQLSTFLINVFWLAITIVLGSSEPSDTAVETLEYTSTLGNLNWRGV